MKNRFRRVLVFIFIFINGKNILYSAELSDFNNGMVIDSLCNYNIPDKQKEIILHILNNPDKYKPAILEYLKKNRNYNNPKEWPCESVLYTIGLTQDTVYFGSLIPLLKNSMYAKSSCIYDCGIVFAISLTCPLNGIEEIKKIKQIYPSTATTDIIHYYQLLNSVPDNIEKRRQALKHSLDFADLKEAASFVKMQKMSTDDLLAIAINKESFYLDRIKALTVIEYLSDSPEILNELLVILIQGSDYASDEFKDICFQAIINIISRNK